MTAADPVDPHAQLFARYLKALALLCECQPYVDEPDYEAQLDAVLREACAAYGLEMRHVDGRFEIALDRPLSMQEAAALRTACRGSRHGLTPPTRNARPRAPRTPR